MLQKEEVVLAAIQEHQPVLQNFVIRSEVVAKQRSPGFRDDIVFNVGQDLRHQLPNQPQNVAARRLHFRQLSLDHMRLLASFEILSAFPDVFLAFQDHIAELVQKFRGQKFQ